MSLMLYAYDRAVQTNADRRPILIELRIVRTRHDHIGCGSARNCLRNQFSNQQTRDRSVAVWKVEKIFVRFLIRDGIAVHSFTRSRAQIQTRKAGCSESPCVLRGYGVKSYAEQGLRHGLKHFD